MEVRALEGPDTDPYGPTYGPLRAHGPTGLRAHEPTTDVRAHGPTGLRAHPDMTWTEPGKRGAHEILQYKIKGACK